MDSIQVLAINEGDNLDFKDLLGDSFVIEVVEFTHSVSVALQKLNVVTPDVILYHPLDDGNEFQKIQEMNGIAPQATIMVLANHSESDYVRECLRSGAQDYLLLPVDTELLEQELTSAHTRRARRQHKETLSVLMQGFTGKPRVIGFMSAKGGVGKTTIAVNTAVALAEMKKKVVLVDLDCLMGGVQFFLNLAAENPFSEVNELSKEHLAQNISDYLETHSSGVSVLRVPKMEDDLFTPATLRVILQALKRSFQFIVVDLPPAVDNYFLSVVEMANECYLISTPNIGTLSVNHKLMELLRKLDYNTDKIYQVINCTGVKQGIRYKEVERLLKTQVRMSVPYDFKGAEKAINSGEPLLLSSRTATVSKALREIAKTITSHYRAVNKSEKADPKPIENSSAKPV